MLRAAESLTGVKIRCSALSSTESPLRVKAATTVMAEDMGAITITGPTSIQLQNVQPPEDAWPQDSLPGFDLSETGPETSPAPGVIIPRRVA